MPLATKKGTSFAKRTLLEVRNEEYIKKTMLIGIDVVYYKLMDLFVFKKALTVDGQIILHGPHALNRVQIRAPEM